MNKVEKALVRIDDGSFGTCADCGEDIADKRLEARPVAKFCIDCKTKQRISGDQKLKNGDVIKIVSTLSRG